MRVPKWRGEGGDIEGGVVTGGGGASTSAPKLHANPPLPPLGPPTPSNGLEGSPPHLWGVEGPEGGEDSGEGGHCVSPVRPH